MRMSVSPQDSEPIRLSNEDDTPSITNTGRKADHVLFFA